MNDLSSSVAGSCPWFQKLSVSERGIVSGGDGRWGIGAILIVERLRQGELLLVRKARRPGYAFSGHLTFPGGMVRSDARQLDRRNIAAAIVSSLVRRVQHETGYGAEDPTKVEPLSIQPPPVSSYVAKGATQYTVVIPFVLRDSVAEFVPFAGDPSVSWAGWKKLGDCWHRLAPANCVIAAHYASRRLSARMRTTVDPFVAAALKRTTQWAMDIGLPPAPAPW